MMRSERLTQPDVLRERKYYNRTFSITKVADELGLSVKERNIISYEMYRYKHAGYAHGNYDDMQQIMFIAYLQLKDKRDMSMDERQWHGYLRARLRGAVQDYIRSLDHLSRDARRKHKREHIKYLLSPGRGFTSIDDYTAALISIDVSTSLTDALLKDRFFEFETAKINEMDRTNKLQLIYVAAEKNLSPRYNLVFNLYYKTELTLEQIGTLIGVNQSRVSQILKSILTKIRSELTPVQQAA